MNKKKRVAVAELNSHLLCILCGGYYVDATTIIECLHTFCKSCIVRYLETSKFCPICDVLVHKTHPLLSIRPDTSLQNIVYKLIPGLLKNEMCRRKRFYSERVGSHPSSENDGGDHTKTEYLIPSDSVSVALKPFVTPSENHNDQNGFHTRYFNCPAGVTLAQLKRLLRAKFDLPENHPVIISLSKDDVLEDKLTLMDVAYIKSWKKESPLVLYYKIYFNKKVKRESWIEEMPIKIEKREKYDIDEDRTMPKLEAEVESHCVIDCEKRSIPKLSPIGDLPSSSPPPVFYDNPFVPISEPDIKPTIQSFCISKPNSLPVSTTYKTIIPAPLRAVPDIVSFSSLGLSPVDSLAAGNCGYSYGIGLLANTNGSVPSLFPGSLVDPTKIGGAVLPFGLTLAPSLICASPGINNISSFQDQSSLAGIGGLNLHSLLNTADPSNNLIFSLSSLDSSVIPSISSHPVSSVVASSESSVVSNVPTSKSCKKPKLIRPKKCEKQLPAVEEKEVQLMISESGVMIVNEGDKPSNQLPGLINPVDSEANELLSKMESGSLLSSDPYSEDSKGSDISDGAEKLAQIKEEISCILNTLSEEAQNFAQIPIEESLSSNPLGPSVPVIVSSSQAEVLYSVIDKDQCKNIQNITPTKSDLSKESNVKDFPKLKICSDKNVKIIENNFKSSTNSSHSSSCETLIKSENKQPVKKTAPALFEPSILPLANHGHTKVHTAPRSNDDHFKKKAERKHSQPVGYKTLKVAPRGWNPTISREVLHKKICSTTKPSKFFKARNSAILSSISENATALTATTAQNISSAVPIKSSDLSIHKGSDSSLDMKTVKNLRSGAHSNITKQLSDVPSKTLENSNRITLCDNSLSKNSIKYTENKLRFPMGEELCLKTDENVSVVPSTTFPTSEKSENSLFELSKMVATNSSTAVNKLASKKLKSSSIVETRKSFSKSEGKKETALKGNPKTGRSNGSKLDGSDGSKNGKPNNSKIGRPDDSKFGEVDDSKTGKSDGPKMGHNSKSRSIARAISYLHTKADCSDSLEKKGSSQPHIGAPSFISQNTKSDENTLSISIAEVKDLPCTPASLSNTTEQRTQDKIKANKIISDVAVPLVSTSPIEKGLSMSKSTSLVECDLKKDKISSFKTTLENGEHKASCEPKISKINSKFREFETSKCFTNQELLSCDPRSFQKDIGTAVTSLSSAIKITQIISDSQLSKSNCDAPKDVYPLHNIHIGSKAEINDTQQQYLASPVDSASDKENKSLKEKGKDVKQTIHVTKESYFESYGEKPLHTNRSGEMPLNKISKSTNTNSSVVTPPVSSVFNKSTTYTTSKETNIDLQEKPAQLSLKSSEAVNNSLPPNSENSTLIKTSLPLGGVRDCLNTSSLLPDQKTKALSTVSQAKSYTGLDSEINLLSSTTKTLHSTIPYSTSSSVGASNSFSSTSASLVTSLSTLTSHATSTPKVISHSASTPVRTLSSTLNPVVTPHSASSILLHSVPSHSVITSSVTSHSASTVAVTKHSTSTSAVTLHSVLSSPIASTSLTSLSAVAPNSASSAVISHSPSTNVAASFSASTRVVASHSASTRVVASHASTPMLASHFASIPVVTSHSVSIPGVASHTLSTPVVTSHSASTPVVTSHFASTTPVVTLHSASTTPVLTSHSASTPVATSHSASSLMATSTLMVAPYSASKITETSHLTLNPAVTLPLTPVLISSTAIPSHSASTQAGTCSTKLSPTVTSNFASSPLVSVYSNSSITAATHSTSSPAVDSRPLSSSTFPLYMMSNPVVASHALASPLVTSHSATIPEVSSQFVCPTIASHSVSCATVSSKQMSFPAVTANLASSSTTVLPLAGPVVTSLLVSSPAVTSHLVSNPVSTLSTTTAVTSTLSISTDTSHLVSNNKVKENEIKEKSSSQTESDAITNSSTTVSSVNQICTSLPVVVTSSSTCTPVFLSNSSATSNKLIDKVANSTKYTAEHVYMQNNSNTYVSSSNTASLPASKETYTGITKPLTSNIDAVQNLMSTNNFSLCQAPSTSKNFQTLTYSSASANDLVSNPSCAHNSKESNVNNVAAPHDSSMSASSSRSDNSQYSSSTTVPSNQSTQTVQNNFSVSQSIPSSASSVHVSGNSACSVTTIANTQAVSKAVSTPQCSYSSGNMEHSQTSSANLRIPQSAQSHLHSNSLATPHTSQNAQFEGNSSLSSYSQNNCGEGFYFGNSFQNGTFPFFNNFMPFANASLPYSTPLNSYGSTSTSTAAQQTRSKLLSSPCSDHSRISSSSYSATNTTPVDSQNNSFLSYPTIGSVPPTLQDTSKFIQNLLGSSVPTFGNEQQKSNLKSSVEELDRLILQTISSSVSENKIVEFLSGSTSSNDGSKMEKHTKDTSNGAAETSFKQNSQTNMVPLASVKVTSSEPVKTTGTTVEQSPTKAKGSGHNKDKETSQQMHPDNAKVNPSSSSNTSFNNTITNSSNIQKCIDYSTNVANISSQAYTAVETYKPVCHQPQCCNHQNESANSLPNISSSIKCSSGPDSQQNKPNEDNVHIPTLTNMKKNVQLEQVSQTVPSSSYGAYTETSQYSSAVAPSNTVDSNVNKKSGRSSTCSAAAVAVTSTSVMNNYQDSMPCVSSSVSAHKQSSQTSSWDSNPFNQNPLNPFLFNNNGDMYGCVPTAASAYKGSFTPNANNCIQQNMFRNNTMPVKDNTMNAHSQNNFNSSSNLSCSSKNSQYGIDHTKKGVSNASESYDNFSVGSQKYNPSHASLYYPNYNNNYTNFFSNSQGQSSASLTPFVSGTGYNFPLSGSKFTSGQQYLNFSQNNHNNSYFSSGNFGVNGSSNYQNCINQSTSANTGGSNPNSNLGNNFSGPLCNISLPYYSNCSFSYNSYPYFYQGDMSLLSPTASFMPPFSCLPSRSSLSSRNSSSSQSFNDFSLQSSLFPMMPFVPPLQGNGARATPSPVTGSISSSFGARSFPSNYSQKQVTHDSTKLQKTDQQLPKAGTLGSGTSSGKSKHRKTNSTSKHKSSTIKDESKLPKTTALTVPTFTAEGGVISSGSSTLNTTSDSRLLTSKEGNNNALCEGNRNTVTVDSSKQQKKKDISPQIN